MKIDSHKNVKVNIFKTKNKFNGEKHKEKEKGAYKNVPIGTALLRSNVIYWETMETTWKDSWEHFLVGILTIN